MNLALNNVVNLLNAIPEEDYKLIVLFNGPAVKLVTSPAVTGFHRRIKDLRIKDVRFQVCKNAMVRFDITENQIIEECEIIPAGIVTLIDLQKDSFAYIKP